jgi:hypothetical protein
MWEADDEPTVNELRGSWFLRCRRRPRRDSSRERKRKQLAG